MEKRLENDYEIHEIRLPVGLLKHDEYLELAIPERGERIMFTDGSLPIPRLVVKKKEASE